jgi:hypothetical protein
MKRAYQAAVAKLREQFKRQLQDVELRVHEHHHGAKGGPVATLQSQVERLQQDNRRLQVLSTCLQIRGFCQDLHMYRGPICRMHGS